MGYAVGAARTPRDKVGLDPEPDEVEARGLLAFCVAIGHHSLAADHEGPAPTEVRSVIPDGRHETEGVAGDRHMTDGRERQVSGHQLLAARRQLLQETDPDAG
jgi:hypothetical protein